MTSANDRTMNSNRGHIVLAAPPMVHHVFITVLPRVTIVPAASCCLDLGHNLDVADMMECLLCPIFSFPSRKTAFFSDIVDGKLSLVFR